MTRPHPALVAVAAGRDVAPIGDRAAFLRSVSEHRMTGTVLAAHQRGEIPLPEETALTLGMWDLAERRDHLTFWRTACEVQDVLAPLGAEVAVLKGIATEARWYDELGQRAATDLDLLLAPDALGDAHRVMETIDPDHGYPVSIDALVGRRQLQHVDLHVGAVQVDLHFDPLKVGVPTRHLDDVWAATEILDTEWGTIRVLPPEVELVMLLLHLNKDRFAYLGPFLDIGRILDHAPLDWDRLRAFVAGEGLDVPVWKSLGAVTDQLGLDQDVPAVRGPRALLWDRLWGPHARLGGDEARSEAPTTQRFLHLHVAHRPGDTARETRRQVLPPRQLLEAQGLLSPGRSYLGDLVLRRGRRRVGRARPVRQPMLSR